MWIFNRPLPIQLAVIEIENLQVTDSQEAFQMLEVTGESYRLQNRGLEISEVYGVQNARQFFRAIGLDPTKRRPSSESLLRRALKNKGFYSVNSLVDTGNWCSLDFLLPICIYDADKIEGDVDIRMGDEDDIYEALNGETISFEGRYVFVDDQGAFGSPMTDSKRTAVSESTQHAYLIIFAPINFDEETLKENADLFVERVQATCGGSCNENRTLKGQR